MTIPHRNFVARIPARCPNDHHEPTVEGARRDEARFAIVTANVRRRRGAARKYLRGIREIEATMLQSGGPFRRIESDTDDLT
jgi:hypothetical protein